MKTDPHTKESFKPNRSNQKFACASNRINFHNSIARKKRMVTRKIDYAINKNWNILLKQLESKDKTIRTKEFLLGAGFDFRYYQRAFESDKGVILAIYNCGFIVKNESIIIIKLNQ